MRRRANVKYTEFQELILQRFDTSDLPYEKRGEVERWNIDILLNGPEQYGVESEMLKYAKENKEASVDDLIRLLDKLIEDKDPPDFDNDDE